MGIMGNIEERSKRKAKQTHIQDTVLLYFRTVGAMAAVALSPNPTMYKLLYQMDPDSSRKRDVTYRVREAAKRLETGGLVKRDHKGQFALTRKGERRAALLESLQNIHVMKSHDWDEKWRIVIFDVWERRRDIRRRLRTLLGKAGFVRLQDSVWVYPYPCEEFVAFIRADLRLGSGMLYIIADEIENDKYLKEYFGFL